MCPIEAYGPHIVGCHTEQRGHALMDYLVAHLSTSLREISEIIKDYTDIFSGNC